MKRSLICGLLLLDSGNVCACKCFQNSLAEQFSHSSVVFVGSTNADPSKETNSRETISFRVSRSLKGAPPVGAAITIDPLFGTDCTASFVPGTQLLVFAHSQETGALVAGACSILATEPISVGGKSMQPPPQVVKFLQELPN
jgi:hypothetical protein